MGRPKGTQLRKCPRCRRTTVIFIPQGKPGPFGMITCKTVVKEICHTPIGDSPRPGTYGYYCKDCFDIMANK